MSTIILDFDGVLCDSFDEIYWAVRRSFCDFFEDTPPLRPSKEIVRKILGTYPKLSTGLAAMCNVTKPNLAAFESIFNKRFQEFYTPSFLKVNISNEIKTLLNVLPEYFDEICIASNKPHDLLVKYCEKKLKGFDINRIFGRRNGLMKPMKEFLPEDLSQKRKVYVGDTITDIKFYENDDPARSCFVGVDWGYGNSDFKKDVLKLYRSFYVYSPFELIYVLDKIMVAS